MMPDRNRENPSGDDRGDYNNGAASARKQSRISFNWSISIGNVLTALGIIVPVLAIVIAWGMRLTAQQEVESATRAQQFNQLQSEMAAQGHQEQRDIDNLNTQINQNVAAENQQLSDIKAILTDLQNRLYARWDNSSGGH